MRIFWFLLAALLFAAPGADSAPLHDLRDALRAAKPKGTLCDLYASPGAAVRPAGARGRGRHLAVLGSKGNPFRSAQRLVNALHPGQTGCLTGGTYGMDSEGLKFPRSGTAAEPITVRSAPGKRARILGGPVYIPAGADDIRLTNLNIDTRSTGQVGVQIMSTGDALIGDHITNHRDRTSCVILGSNLGWGAAADTVIANDLIYDCGSAADGNQDHAIYFDNSTDAIVKNNVIRGTSAFAIHLYQSSQGSQITHNVIIDNGYGVIFAGSDTHTSNDNLVADNIIADSRDGPDVQSYWGGAVGHGNVLRDNCIYTAGKGAIGRPTVGFATVGNVIARPGFVNATKHNYALRPGSPCLRVVGFDAAASATGAH
jgi:parallel beta-helix repeat protein